MRRVFAYLLFQRGIDRDVLYSFAHNKMIYESKKHHNAVFVGYDTNGIPRHAHKRGTGSESTYKGNAPSGVPEYSFHWHGRSPYVCLFEAPIDMLSHIALYPAGWREHGYLSLGGVSSKALERFLSECKDIESVFIATDNDEAGNNAAENWQNRFRRKYRSTDFFHRQKTGMKI